MITNDRRPGWRVSFLILVAAEAAWVLIVAAALALTAEGSGAVWVFAILLLAAVVVPLATVPWWRLVVLLALLWIASAVGMGLTFAFGPFWLFEVFAILVLVVPGLVVPGLFLMAVGWLFGWLIPFGPAAALVQRLGLGGDTTRKTVPRA